MSTDNIVIQPAHQLADHGVGKKAERHALEVREQRRPEPVYYPFTYLGICLTLENAQDTVYERDSQQTADRPEQVRQVFIRQRMIDQVPDDERGD